jgi:outer membrane protein OmpA-like peptidoglycan-associated protein
MFQRMKVLVRPRRSVPGVALALAALLLAGCSSTPDWANPVEWYHGAAGWFGDDDAEAESARARAAAKAKATPPGAYPNLSTVPQRPKDISNTSQANQVEKGLVADRSQARYTELELTPPPPAPPAPSPAQPPVTAAPSAPVQAAPLPRPAESPTAEGSKPSSAAAPAASAPPTPPGPPPQADIPAPDTTARTRETSQSARMPPVPAVPSAEERRDAASPSRSDNLAAVPQSAARAPAPAGIQVGTVLFANNSSKVLDSYDKLLQNIVNMMKEKGGILRVVGHASPGGRGSDPLKQRLANFRVSLARANAVARELVRLGVPTGNVMVEGRADNEPLYQEAAPAGEAGNRRAEIYIDYPKGRR